MATPTPRPQNAVPEIYALAQRRGTTVGIFRRQNFCTWAVLNSEGKMLTGPRHGEAVNPGDSDLAKLITAAIEEIRGEDKVYLLDRKIEDLLAEVPTDFDYAVSAPPFGARSRITSAMEKRAAKLCSSISLYTDASKGTGSTLGTGWTIAYGNGPDPIFGAETHRAQVAVSGAELLAIRDGLASVESLHQDLMEVLDGRMNIVIRSDSRDALRIVENLISGQPVPSYGPPMRDACKSIVAFASKATLRTEWVRGHDGTPGNEAADRLAVNARRVAEFDTPIDVARRLLREIIIDERINVKAA